MKALIKKLLIISITMLVFVDFQVIARGVPVANISNECTCKAVNNTTSCTKGSSPMSIEFGIAVVQDNSNEFKSTNPPTIIAPGSKGIAPVTAIYWNSRNIPGIIFRSSDGFGDGVGYARMSDLGDPSALKVVAATFSFDGKSYATVIPLNAAWIDSNCKYSGPQGAITTLIKR